MGSYILAYDLGTGGNKASLYDENGHCEAESFEPYPTYYPQTGYHEQRPEEWWLAVVKSTQRLLETSGIDPGRIVCCGISGHSLGVVPLDREGELLRRDTPIWSDSRAVTQAEQYFQQIAEQDWYTITGNGFPAPLYSVFELMWYAENEPEMFSKLAKFIGTKDYINYRMTGEMLTDYSYASGSGVYDLVNWQYSEELIGLSGLPASIFPEIVASSEVIGTILPEAASELGLPAHIKIVAGGVDNSCMALGARNVKEGRVYNSVGSSSWIAVSSEKPIINPKSRPFVFTHVVPGLFSSAVSIFSAGNSFRWVRDQLCRDLIEDAKKSGTDVYDLMTAEAGQSSVGSNRLIFNPSLAGGTSLDDSIHIRGAYVGLDLGHERADLIRAAMEGVAMGLRLALDELQGMTALDREMVLVGGGSRSQLWRQIFADVYETDVVKTNIDQQAAALGAAALAAVGIEMWPGFDIIDDVHQVESIETPNSENVQKYKALVDVFKSTAKAQSAIGDQLAKINV